MNVYHSQLNRPENLNIFIRFSSLLYSSQRLQTIHTHTIHNPQSTIHTHTIIKKVNKYISINNHRAFSNSMKCRLLCLKTPNENKVDLGCVIRRLSPCILMTLSGSDMLPVVPVGFCRLAIEGTH